MSGKRALGILAEATIGLNSQKSLKLNISDFSFSEQIELLKYFGETLGQIPPISARQLWFIFF